MWLVRRLNVPLRFIWLLWKYIEGEYFEGDDVFFIFVY